MAFLYPSYPLLNPISTIEGPDSIFNSIFIWSINPETALELDLKTWPLDSSTPFTDHSLLLLLLSNHLSISVCYSIMFFIKTFKVWFSFIIYSWPKSNRPLKKNGLYTCHPFKIRFCLKPMCYSIILLMLEDSRMGSI